MSGPPEGRDGARLVAEDLACGYGPEPVLEAVDLLASGGAACIVVGRSGSGRSTLAQALAGFMPRLTGGWCRGRVALQSAGGLLDQAATSPATWLEHVAWYGAPPRAGLSGARRTVHGELALALELRGVPTDAIRRRCADVLQATGLERLEGRDPRTLSDGETARLALGAVLIAGPDAVVLDDPEAYVDAAGLRELLDLVAGDAAGRRGVVACTGRPAALAEAAPAWFGASRALVLDGHGVAAEGAAAATLGRLDVLAHGVLPCPAVADAPWDHRAREPAWRPRPGAEPGPVTIERASTAAAGHGAPTRPSMGAGAVERGAWFDAGAWDALATDGAPCQVEALGIDVAFGGRPALRGATVRAEPGTVTALIGANGGGKTTLLRVLAGLLAPHAGAVRVGGGDPRGWTRRIAARRVGLVGSRAEDLAVARSVRADVALGPRWCGVPRADRDAAVEAALAAAGLAAAAGEHPHELPAAARRWTAISAALVLRPAVVLLDEPTVGLDAPAQLRLEAALATWRRQGRTVVLASHDLDFVAETADRVVVLSGGVVLADGAPEALLGDRALLAGARLAPPSRLALAAALGVAAFGAGSRAALWAALDERRSGAGRSGPPRYN